MITGILGKKIGMTQVFKDNGKFVPVTVIEAGPCAVLQLKTAEKDGYEAVQLGFDEKRESLVNRPDMGKFKKAKASPKRFIREIKVSKSSEFKLGQTVDIGIFEPGEFVDITGVSIGKGFQGGMKRHNWHGGEASHGSMFHRAPGSIGASSFPSRVTKGHGMPGHMGDEVVTVQNLEVVKVDKENNLLVIKGAIPGKQNAFVVVRASKKVLKGSKIAKRKLTPTPPPKKREGAKTGARKAKT
ncbi:MAG: 50S ribosomal protein L3 [Candidatus Omnitrophota bacterium]